MDDGVWQYYMSLNSIDIKNIPRCVISVGTKNLRDELMQLDIVADGGRSDGYFTEENFKFLKPSMVGLQRFASFRDFRKFIEDHIHSQMCSETCLDESQSQRREGVCIAPPAPKLPPLSTVSRPKPPKAPPAKRKAVANKKTPPPPPQQPSELQTIMKPRKLKLELSTAQLLALVEKLDPPLEEPKTCHEENPLNPPRVKQPPKPKIISMPYGDLRLPEEMHLVRRLSDGSIIVKNGFVLGHFEAKIKIDGTVEMENRIPAKVSAGAGTMLGATVTTYGFDDMIERLRGTDYAAPAKLKFLDATRDDRFKMYEAATKAALSSSRRWLASHLSDILQSNRSWAEKRKLFFDLWDECVDGTMIRENSSDLERAQAATGIAVKKMIIEFIQKHIPQGSHQQYSTSELAAFNAERARDGASPFEPYKRIE